MEILVPRRGNHQQSVLSFDIRIKKVKTADPNNITEQDEEIAGSSVFTTNQDHLNITVHNLPASTSMSSPPPTSSLYASPNIYEYTPSTNREVRIKQLSWEAVCPFPKVIKLYTGCSSEKVFMFIVNRVRSKHKKVSYFKDSSRSFTIK